MVPMLEPAAKDPGAEPRPLDPEGTALVVGGLTGLGSVVARHLARSGARRILLASRRGPAAPRAAELTAELAELGCEAKAVACDASRRDELQALIESIPDEHPLTAVVHCAAGSTTASSRTSRPSASRPFSAPRPTAPGTCTS